MDSANAYAVMNILSVSPPPHAPFPHKPCPHIRLHQTLALVLHLRVRWQIDIVRGRVRDIVRGGSLALVVLLRVRWHIGAERKCGGGCCILLD